MGQDNNIIQQSEVASLLSIENRIFIIREQQVMLDKDLAELYGVETKVLNQAVKRNIDRFPEQFRFQITHSERDELVTNCDRFKLLKHSSSLPYVFTEQGVAMISAVLHSATAIRVSVRIMEAFIAMRKFLLNNAQIFQRLGSLEEKQMATDKKIDLIFSKLEQGDVKPSQGIFYDGQIFDAHLFVSNLIKSGNKSIVLIDNYINENTFALFSECPKDVEITIYTQKITSKLNLDLQKFNAEYTTITLKEFQKSHDRFLIIDSVVYHFGASLKDLGKKWFAFSKMELSSNEMLENLERNKK